MALNILAITGLILCIIYIWIKIKKKEESTDRLYQPDKDKLFDTVSKTKDSCISGADPDSYKQVFLTSAKLSFLYQGRHLKLRYTVRVNALGQQNGFPVVEGYCEETRKKGRFWESRISDCIDIETGKNVGNLVVFLRQRKDGVNRQPDIIMTDVYRETMTRHYDQTAPTVSMTSMEQRSSPPVFSSRSNASMELLIKYTSHGQRIERRISVQGLGKYKDCHYIIAHCHQANATRHFKLQKFRSCVDLGTGEVITKVKDYILAYNPIIVDLTDEFNALSEQRDREN